MRKDTLEDYSSTKAGCRPSRGSLRQSARKDARHSELLISTIMGGEEVNNGSTPAGDG